MVWGDLTVAVYRYRTMFPVLRLQASGRLGWHNGTPAIRSLTSDDSEPLPLESTIEECFEPISHEGEPLAHGAEDASPMEWRCASSDRRSAALRRMSPGSSEERVMSLNNIVSACGAVGSAVVGGIYTNFSVRVMPWLGSLPDAEAIETMQKFNRTAVQVPFTTFFFGTAIASTWTVVHNVRKTDRGIGDQISAAGGVLYLAGWVLTIVYNVPRNNRLADVVAGTAEGARVWHMYLDEWTSANSVRAVLSLLGAVALGVGTAMNIFSKSR